MTSLSSLGPYQKLAVCVRKLLHRKNAPASRCSISVPNPFRRSNKKNIDQKTSRRHVYTQTISARNLQNKKNYTGCRRCSTTIWPARLCYQCCEQCYQAPGRCSTRTDIWLAVDARYEPEWHIFRYPCRRPDHVKAGPYSLLTRLATPTARIHREFQL